MENYYGKAWAGGTSGFDPSLKFFLSTTLHELGEGAYQRGVRSTFTPVLDQKIKNNLNGVIRCNTHGNSHGRQGLQQHTAALKERFGAPIGDVLPDHGLTEAFFLLVKHFLSASVKRRE